MKKQHDIATVYKSLTTSSNSTITVSGNHLIHASKNGNDVFKTV